MVDTSALGEAVPPARPVAASANENLRIYSIVIYALYLAAFCNGGLTALVGVILAYAKRAEARGTPFESHFNNAIDVFWVGLVILLVAFPLIFLFGLGILVYCGLIVWYLYRTITGLVRAIDGNAY